MPGSLIVVSSSVCEMANKCQVACHEQPSPKYRALLLNWLGRREHSLIKMNFLFILSTQKTDAEGSSNSFPVRVSEVVYKQLPDGKVTISKPFISLAMRTFVSYEHK